MRTSCRCNRTSTSIVSPWQKSHICVRTLEKTLRDDITCLNWETIQFFPFLLWDPVFATLIRWFFEITFQIFEYYRLECVTMSFFSSSFYKHHILRITQVSDTFQRHELLPLLCHDSYDKLIYTPVQALLKSALLTTGGS